MVAALLQSVANLSVPAALLDAAGRGAVHFSPVYAPDASDQLVDLAYVRLNPAAQQLLGLPEFPATTLLSLHPAATDTFAFYRAAFWAGDLRHRQLHLAADGCDYQVQAQRHGPHLVVSLTAPPAAGRPASPAPDAAGLAVGRAEQAARQLAQEHDAFRRIFSQAPAAIGLLRAPEYRFEYVNPAFARLFSPVALEGMPAAQVLPEALNQGFMTLLDRVYATGENVLEAEVRLPADSPGPTRYFNFTFQAHLPENQAEADRHADRLSMFAFDVTEQVVARQQVQHLNQELQAANEELRANNAELAQAQRQLQQLNQELECRVAAGVRAAQEAQAEAESQRQRLTRFFQQAPVAICVLTGPDLVYELVNPMYQQRFAGRELLGQPVHHIPELQATDIPDMLHAVYQTGIPHEGHEVWLPQLTHAGDDRREDAYFNCLYQPRYDEHGHIDGVLAFAFDVTEQVKARRLTSLLNQELEHRVAERTAQLRAALHKAEQRAQLRNQ